MWSPAWEPVGLAFTYALQGQKGMDARREAQRISSIRASRATTQTRFLAATRRDGPLSAHFCVTRPRRTSRTPSDSRLELRRKRLRRICKSKSHRLLGDRNARPSIAALRRPARPGAIADRVRA